MRPHKYPTLKRLADPAQTTTGYQEKELLSEGVACYHELNWTLEVCDDLMRTISNLHKKDWNNLSVHDKDMGRCGCNICQSVREKDMLAASETKKNPAKPAAEPVPPAIKAETDKFVTMTMADIIKVGNYNIWGFEQKRTFCDQAIAAIELKEKLAKANQLIADLKRENAGLNTMLRAGQNSR